MRKLTEDVVSALEIVADESSAVAAVIDTRDDYRIVWHNKRLEEHLGYPVLGMRWGGRCPFVYGINGVQVLDKVAETGQPVRAEERPFSARVSSRFGETTYWNWKVLPISSGGCKGCVLVMAENVTDRVARRAAEQHRKVLFAGVVLDLPVGVAMVDPKDFRVLDANDIFLSYLPPDYQTRESIGKTLNEIVPYFGYSGLEDIFRRVATTREVFAAHEFELKDPLRQSLWWSLTVRPVTAEDGSEALLITTWDVTEQVNARRRAEQTRRSAQALIKVQQAISSSLALNEVLSLITASARELLNSPAASVFMLSDGKMPFVPMGATGIDLTGAGQKALESKESLASRALREHRAVTVAEEEVTEFAKVSTLQNGHAITAIAAAPIEAEDNRIGVIEVYNDEHRRYTNDELDALSTLASAASTAIVNARLYEEAQRSGRELEMRNRVLDNERKLLVAVLDSMPDAVIVADANHRVAHANEAARWLFKAQEGQTLSIPDMMRATHPRMLDGREMSPDEHPLVRAIKGEELRNLEFMLDEGNGRLHYRSVSGGPVRDKDGNIIFGVAVGRDVTDAKVMQARLEEAYERERRIAQTFQQALLSEVPGEMNGIRMAQVYEAGLRESELGGDFFDIFSPAKGKLAVVIGDVAGKGLSAAIQIAAVKYGIRGFAYEDPSPSRVAARTNDFMCRERTVGGFVSVFYGLVDIKSRVLVYANAGHEPPLMRHRNGDVERLLSNGLVMGVTPGFQYEERTLEMRKDDKLLLYTDGITEARKDSGEMLGEDRLIAFWRGTTDGAKASLDAVYHWAKDFSEGHFHDDVAMLVMAVEGTREGA